MFSKKHTFSEAKLQGSSSGTLTIKANASTSSYTLTWPANVGTDGYALTTNGSGVLSWSEMKAGESESPSSTSSANLIFTGVSSKETQAITYTDTTTIKSSNVSINTLSDPVRYNQIYTMGASSNHCWVVVGEGTNTIGYSTNGTNWKGLGTSVFSTAGYDIAWSGYIWVAVGAGTNTIAYSYNGTRWEGLGTSIFSTAGRGVYYYRDRFVAVGEGTNTIAYSFDGIHWTGGGTSIFSTRGYGVVANGTVWVAVGQGTNSIAYSSDGITWNGRGTALLTSYGRGICWTGKRFVAVGAGTYSIATSFEGIAWFPVSGIFSTEGTDTIPNGTLTVATGLGGNSLAYSYNNGVSWTGLSTTHFTSGYGVSWNGKYFIAVGSGGNTIAQSYDGINWYGLGYSVFTTSGYKVAYNNAREHQLIIPTLRTVAMGTGSVSSVSYTSDGINWENGTNIFTTTGTHCAWNGKMWVGTGSGTNTLAFSYDGKTWYGLLTSVFSTKGWYVAWANNMWVALGSGTNTIAWSRDGFTWRGLGTSYFSTEGRGVVYGADKWVAVGSGTNTIVYSTDGITWTTATNTVSTAGRSIVWSGDMYVVVGSGTDVVNYSRDGITWYAGTGSPPTSGNGVAYNNGRFVAVGSSTIKTAYSNDGISWTSSTSPFSTAGNGVLWADDRWIAGGEGTHSIAYSFDGITWYGLGLSNTSTFTTGKGIAYDGTNFVAVGSGSNSIAYSSNATSWTSVSSQFTEGRCVAWNRLDVDKQFISGGTGGGVIRYTASGNGSLGSWTQATSVGGLTECNGVDMSTKLVWVNDNPGGAYKANTNLQTTTSYTYDPNGSTWFSTYNNGLKAYSVYGYATDGNYSVACTASNYIWYTQNDIYSTWTQSTNGIPSSGVYSIVYGNSRWVIGCSNGALLYNTSSPNNAFSSVSTPFSGPVYRLLYAKSLNRFLAIGDSVIALSSDGNATSFSSQQTTTNGVFNGTWSESATRFMVTGSSGMLWTSTNGTSWTNLSTNHGFGTGTIHGVAYGNGKWVISSNTSPYLQYSTNSGSTWSNATISANGTLGEIYWNGSKFFINGYGSLGTGVSLATSTDGITWTTISNSGYITGYANHRSSDEFQRAYKLIAGGAGTKSIAYSIDDGVNWTAIAGSDPFSTRCNGILWGKSSMQWMAFGEGTNAMAYSTDDGYSWTGLGTSIFTKGYAGVYDGTMMLSGNETSNCVAISRDSGISWTKLSSVASGKYATGVCVIKRGTYAGRWLVTLSSTYAVIYTDNCGSTWSAEKTTGLSNLPNAISAKDDGSLIVAISAGASNNTAYSTDGGDTWTTITNSAIAQDLQYVRWFEGAGLFIVTSNGTAGGASQMIGYSSNGSSWTSALSQTGVKAYFVTYDHVNNYVVVSGNSTSNGGGAMWYSVGGTSFSTVYDPNFSGTILVGYEYGGIPSNRGYVGLHSRSGTSSTYSAYTTSSTSYPAISSGVVNSTSNQLARTRWNGSRFVTIQPISSSSTTSNLLTATACGTPASNSSGEIWSPLMQEDILLTNYPMDIDSGCKWVAVGEGSSHTIAVSYNGVDRWVGLGKTIFSTAGYCIAKTDTNSIWVAGGEGTNTLAYSVNGINWTGLGTTVFQTSCKSVVWNGTIFVACGDGGTTFAYSANGSSWVTLGASLLTTGVGISTNNSLGGVFIKNPILALGADSTNTISLTVDGNKYIGLGKLTFSTAGRHAVWSGDKWVAVGEGTNTIASSTDSLSWTGAGTSIFSTRGYYIIYTGSLYIAMGEGTNTIATSSDAITWSSQNSTFTTAGRGVYYNGTLYVACGSGTNTLAYSSNATSWTPVSSPPFSTSGNAVIFGLNKWIAVGEGTNVTAYSTDGQTWSAGTAIFTTRGNALAWNGIRFVAGGSGTNALAHSTDGQTWTGLGTSIFTTCTSVAWNGNFFLAGGSGTNSLAISQDGITWFGITTSSFSTSCYGIASNSPIGATMIDDHFIVNKQRTPQTLTVEVIGDEVNSDKVGVNISIIPE
jgi:hypothetical protein